MNMILQIFALMIIMAVVWHLGYTKGKKIQMRELNDMEIPELDKQESLKVLDSLMTDDNFFDDDETVPSTTGLTYEQVKYGDDYFTGNLVKSSKTETDIVKQPINPKRKK